MQQQQENNDAFVIVVLVMIIFGVAVALQWMSFTTAVMCALIIAFIVMARKK